MKKVTALLLFAALVLTVGACSSTASAMMESNTVSGAETVTELAVTGLDQEQSLETASAATAVEYDIEYDQDDLEVSTDTADLSYVTLEGGSIAVEGNGGIVDGSTVTITVADTYSISGTLDDGQIIVDTDDEDTVYLILGRPRLQWPDRDDCRCGYRQWTDGADEWCPGFGLLQHHWRIPGGGRQFRYGTVS